MNRTLCIRKVSRHSTTHHCSTVTNTWMSLNSKKQKKLTNKNAKTIPETQPSTKLHLNCIVQTYNNSTKHTNSRTEAQQNHNTPYTSRITKETHQSLVKQNITRTNSNRPKESRVHQSNEAKNKTRGKIPMEKNVEPTNLPHILNTPKHTSHHEANDLSTELRLITQHNWHALPPMHVIVSKMIHQPLPKHPM